MIYNVTIKILNLTSVKTAKNLKMRNKRAYGRLGRKVQARNENRVSIFVLSLFPNHELKTESEIATNV